MKIRGSIIVNGYKFPPGPDFSSNRADGNIWCGDYMRDDGTVGKLVVKIYDADVELEPEGT